ncbi:MAG: hypothetical protein ACEY3D_03055 [Rickettsia sp.]|uniref:hypothetical protein n=1 Tax=Rickettsia sp. TaxID=789 RepID=UPI00397DF86D
MKNSKPSIIEHSSHINSSNNIVITMLSKDEINKFRTINPTLKANTIVKNLPYLQNVNAAIETILIPF